MHNKYYSLPIELDNLIEPERDDSGQLRASDLQLKKTDDLKKSIDEHIELILTTHYGEYKYNRSYGFIIWDLEFENMEIEKFNTHINPKRDIENSIKKTLTLFEPRLKNVNVEIFFIFKKVFKGKNIKFFVDINVKAIMLGAREEEYHNKFQFAMGPLFK